MLELCYLFHEVMTLYTILFEEVAFVEKASKLRCFDPCDLLVIVCVSVNSTRENLLLH